MRGDNESQSSPEFNIKAQRKIILEIKEGVKNNVAFIAALFPPRNIYCSYGNNYVIGGT